MSNNESKYSRDPNAPLPKGYPYLPEVTGDFNYIQYLLSSVEEYDNRWKNVEWRKYGIYANMAYFNDQKTTKSIKNY